MNLSSKHIKAILRVNHLRKELICEEVTEQDCKNFDNLVEEKKLLITEQVMYVMNHGFADSICYYSNPIEQGIDPFVIYGEKGIYLVHEKEYDGFTFFTNRKEAEKYANDLYDNWLEVYSDEE
jgi:hypothetical protein